MFLRWWPCTTHYDISAIFTLHFSSPKLPSIPLFYLQVKHSKEKFIFTVETTGALHAKEVVKDALAQLNAKIFRLQEILPELVA